MDSDTRRGNRRIGLILGSIALAFFVGAMARLGLFGG